MKLFLAECRQIYWMHLKHQKKRQKTTEVASYNYFPMQSLSIYHFIICLFQCPCLKYMNKDIWLRTIWRLYNFCLHDDDTIDGEREIGEHCQKREIRKLLGVKNSAIVCPLINKWDRSNWMVSNQCCLLDNFNHTR